MKLSHIVILIISSIGMYLSITEWGLLEKVGFFILISCLLLAVYFDVKEELKGKIK